MTFAERKAADQANFAAAVDLAVKQGVPKERAKMVVWLEGEAGYAARLAKEVAA